MKKYFESVITKTGLAIFAMLFGAGNLIFPPAVGMQAGDQTIIGMLGFILSGVLIPLLGLIAITLFDGSYRAFFGRIGQLPGKLMILFCILIIGPLLVMPRIVTLSYLMIKPFIGGSVTILLFSLIFGLVTFLFAFKKNELINIIGKILSPLKLCSLVFIFIIGYLTRKAPIHTDICPSKLFVDGLLSGYQTLDLLGTIFFGYIIISILKSTLQPEKTQNAKTMAKIMMPASLLAGTILGIIYGGFCYIGAWHSHGLEHLSSGDRFVVTLERILGIHGSFIIAATVIIACLTTLIALASVVSEYLRHDVSKNRLSYGACLAIVIGTTIALSQFELAALMQYSEPLIFLIYPVLITLMLCNIAYKLWGFPYVKAPVLIALIISTMTYGPAFIGQLLNGLPHAEQKASEASVDVQP